MFFSFYIRLHLSFDQKIYLTGKKVNVKEILPAFVYTVQISCLKTCLGLYGSGFDPIHGPRWRCRAKFPVRAARLSGNRGLNFLIPQWGFNSPKLASSFDQIFYRR
jgi:hypothetical protein